MCTENYKVGQNNYKVVQLLRIAKWGKYYYKEEQIQDCKVGQNDYKVRQLLQSRAKLRSRAEQHLWPNKLKTNFSKVNSSEVENKVKVNV